MVVVQGVYRRFTTDAAATYASARSGPMSAIRLVFLVFILGAVVAGDYRYFQLQQRSDERLKSAAKFLTANLDHWTAACPGSFHRAICRVVLFTKLAASGTGADYMILGFSDERVFITAPVERSTIVAWRVDNNPFEETLSLDGKGAMLRRTQSRALLEQMLTGKQLTVRFKQSGRGVMIERSFPLAGFPNAFHQYLNMRGKAGSGEAATKPEQGGSAPAVTQTGRVAQLLPAQNGQADR